jgi:DNA-directed RNA polymerase specialized sigma24 family protein
MEHADIARLTALRYARPGEVEDMTQEALYALWREGQRRGELSDARAFLVAKSRVLRVLEQRPLGSERPPGRPPGRNGVTPATEQLTPEGVFYDDQLVAPDPAAEVALRVDVERALGTLTVPEQRTVRVLFWDQASWREARGLLGFIPQATWRSARDKLRIALDQLRTAS